jgi:hypothetical protein
MTHNKDGAFARDWFELMESGQNENRRLSKAGFGLAKNVDVEDSGRNANLLDCNEPRRMLDLFDPFKLVRSAAVSQNVRPSPSI